MQCSRGEGQREMHFNVNIYRLLHFVISIRSKIAVKTDLFCRRKILRKNNLRIASALTAFAQGLCVSTSSRAGRFTQEFTLLATPCVTQGSSLSGVSLI